MNELIDNQILDQFEQMYSKVLENMGIFISDAQALCACFMLIYFGLKLFPVIAGDKKLDIVPLLRPFMIGLVLIFWGPTVTAIKYPMDVITGKAKGQFYAKLDDISALSRERYALIDEVAKELMETTLEIERAEDESGDKPWWDFGIDIEPIMKKIAGLWVLVQSKLKFLLVQLLEKIMVIIFQLSIYLVFFLQIIFASILVILGPLSFSISVLPAFRDAWINWVSRFISVSLYSAIGYIVLTTACTVLEFGLTKEIAILHKVLSNDVAFVMYVSQVSGDVSIFVVCALLGAVGMLTVPWVSTWIVQTSGVNQAVSSMAGAATMAAGKIV